MINPVLMLARNNLHLTKLAVKTVQQQDIPTELLLIDNQSTDGTPQWARTQEFFYCYRDPPLSVAASWNFGLKFLFNATTADYVLVVNNDIELLPDTYSKLLAEDAGFVSCVGRRELPAEPPVMGTEKRPHPDFSCFLIRRWVYEKVGAFDENFKIGFCEDGDYDMRMYKAGIRAYCIDYPFLHHGSMTIKNALPAEIRTIQIQADLNRQYFKKKWGFGMGSPEYYDALGKGSPTDPSLDRP